MKESYECFITKSQKYGLLDGEGELRHTSYDLDGIIKRKRRSGWGKVIRIKVTDKGITFGKEVK